METIYNNVGSELREDFYEAEHHALAGGAVVIEDGECSGGRAARLAGSGQYVEVDASALFGGLHTVTIFYKAVAPAQVYLSANGGAETLVSLPASGSIPASVTATLQLRRGANTVKLRGGSGTGDVDRIYVSGTGIPPVDFTPPEGTNLIDAAATFPGDPNDPLPFYNTVQAFDVNGHFEGHTGAGGQARFELFAGVETQPQSAIIVAVEGASETPAFRDVSYFVTEDYLLKEGQLGNFVFEVEPDIQDLDETLLYLYTLDGKVTAADCDFSLLAGREIPGLVIDHRAPLSETVAALEAWFNFDIVPRGGKITAIPRGGAVASRFYERELRAHLFGEERPRAAVKVTHEDPTDLPGAVDVVYLDPSPSKDFHSGNQTAQKIVGFSFDYETLTFPIVGDADTAQAVGQRYLDARHLAAKPAEIVCGFGKRHFIPTDIVEVELADSTLYTHRIVTKQADLQGMVKFGVVPERASVYTQNGAGVTGRGGDVLLVRPPANTLLVVADCVAVRQEDLGRLIAYAAACPRGVGAWPGYHLNKRDQNGEVERVGGFETAATIGVVETASQSAARFGLEAARSFVVKLYHGSLESRSESEVRAERVNLALYGSGNRWEVIQFLTVTPQVASAPYAAQYLVTGVASGLYGTEDSSDNHQAGDYFVLFDGAVASFPMRPADIGRAFDFTGQTAGQALGDAEAAGVSTLTFQGNSAKLLAPSRVELEDGTSLAPRDAAGNVLVSPWPRSNFEHIGDEYRVDYLTDAGAEIAGAFEVFREGTPQAAMLVSNLSTSKFTGVTASTRGNSFSVSSALTTGRTRSLQKIRQADNFAEANLRGAPDVTVKFGLMAAGKNWQADALDYYFSLGVGGGGVTLEIYQGVALLYSEDATAYYSAGKRFRFRLLGNKVQFFKDYQDESTPPLAESIVTPNYPLLVVAEIATGSAGAGYVELVTMTTNPLPATILTAAQQTAWYGGLKTSGVRVRIRQHSGVREVGYGLPWEGVI